jgi:hypothetical protein
VLERAVTGASGFRVPDDLDASLERFDAIVREIQQLEQQLPETTLVIVLQDSSLLPRPIQPRLKPAPGGPRSTVSDEQLAPATPRERREGTLADRAWRLLPPQRKVQIFDVGVTIVVAIFSALIGIQLLWIPNPTFGGLNDYITALVWGFGLHQLNEVARQGGPTAIGNALRAGPS